MECHLKADLNNNDVKMAFQRRDNHNSDPNVIDLVGKCDKDSSQDIYLKILNTFKSKDFEGMKLIISQNLPKFAHFLEGFPMYPNKTGVNETVFFRILYWWLCRDDKSISIPTLCKEIGATTNTISDVIKVIRTLCFLDANENHQPLKTETEDTIRMEYACIQAGEKYRLIVVLAISIATLNVRLCHFLAEIDPTELNNEDALLSRKGILRVLGASVSKDAKIVVSEKSLKRNLQKIGFQKVELKSTSSHPHGFQFHQFVRKGIAKMIHTDNLCDRNLVQLLITEFSWRQNMHSDDERFCRVISCLHKASEKIDDDLSGSTMFKLLDFVAENAGKEQFEFSSLEKNLFHRPLSSISSSKVTHTLTAFDPNSPPRIFKMDVNFDEEHEIFTIDDSLSASNVTENEMPFLEPETRTTSPESGPQEPVPSNSAQMLSNPSKRGRKTKLRNDIIDSADAAFPKVTPRSTRKGLRSGSKRGKELVTKGTAEEVFTESSPTPPKHTRKGTVRRRSPEPESSCPQIEMEAYYYADTTSPSTSRTGRSQTQKSVQNWKPVQCPHCLSSNKNGLIDKNIDMIPHLLLNHCKRNDDNLWEFRQNKFCKKVSRIKTCYICCETTEFGIIGSHMSSVHQKDVELLSCRICEKDFPTLLDQKRHVEEHHSESEMPYWCPICDVKSSFRHIIIDHYSLFHSKEQKVLCPFCLNAYGYETEDDRSALDSHILKHKNESNVYTCVKCTLNFVSEDEFISHHGRHCMLLNIFVEIGGEAKALEDWKSYVFSKPERKDSVFISEPEKMTNLNLLEREKMNARKWETLSGPNSDSNQCKT